VPHCSTDIRHRRRGIVPSGVQGGGVLPPAPPVPVLPPMLLPPVPAVPVTVVQTPALHVAPAAQGLQPPQCMASPPVGETQEPSEHCVVPPGQLDWQVPALQTSVPVHVIVQLPQWAAFEATQVPLQESKPALQTHWPAWQTWPAPHAVAHDWPPTFPPQPATASSSSVAPRNAKLRALVFIPASVRPR